MNRKIDSLGRIVIPKEMRDQLDIKDGDSINIELVDNKIVISNPNEVDYKQILDEIREFIKSQSPDAGVCGKTILKILDKAK